MLARFLIGLIRLYRVGVSSWTPPTCRFQPTCSSYALEAVERHGALRGGWLAVRRIGRCHPWGGFGFDPVPRGRGEDGVIGRSTATAGGPSASEERAA